MKQINTYIIEKLQLNKNIKVNQDYELDIPLVPDGDTSEISDDTWKIVNIPKAKYIIYIDKYRGRKYHFGSLGDFISQLIYCQDDYEDFDPNKDIVFSSDDFEEAFEWYVDKLGIKKELDKSKKWDEIAKEINDNLKNSHDSGEFFAKVFLGEWNKEDIDRYAPITNDELNNTEKFRDWIDKNFSN